MSKNVEPGSYDDSGAGELTSRRDLIKKAAVGASAAGIIWSAPKVEGFSLRPSYAAAGSGVGGGGVVATTVNLRFAFNGLQISTQAAGTGQLGSNASGNPAFVSVRGTANRTVIAGVTNATRLTLNEFNWNGVGTAFINAMSNSANNVGLITPSAFPTSLPAGTYDASVNALSANVHRWETSFSCS